MDKLLIVGATGLLGSKAIEMGMQQYEVYGTYNQNAQNNLLQLDATNKSEVSKLISNIRPDFVLDTHSITNLPFCEKNKDAAWNINVLGARNIAEESQKVGAKYIFLSTDYVFDGKKAVYTEDDTTNPLNYYGKTKLEAEETLKSLNIDHIIVRTSSIYGSVSSTGKKSFVQWVTESLGKGTRIKVISDLFISPTFNEDLVDIIFKLYKADANGIFHAVGKDNISKYEFAVLISKAFGLDQSLIEPVKSSEFPDDLARPTKVNLSTSKVEKIIGRSPISVTKGLELIKSA